MKAHHRELISFLEQHGATNVRLKHHSRHPRLVYSWRGQPREHVVPGTPSDTARGTLNTIADLRRELGPPLPPQNKPRRNMEDLMPAPRILPATATPLIQPKPDAIAATGSVAHYKTSVRMVFPKIIVETFGRDAHLRHRYLGNLNWEITRSHERRAAGFRTATGRPGAYEVDISKLKDEPTFGATPAEFLVCDGQILVAVKGDRRPLAQARVSAVKPQQQPVSPEAVLAIPSESVPASSLPLDTESRLRNALTEIRALEAQTIYRLVRIKKGDTEHWAWSAPRIE